ncbi:MAG: acyltransferase [Bacteroidota bacterium]
MTDIFIHPTAVVDDPVYIGGGTKIWHFCHIMEHARIGANCSLGQNVFVASRVQIGKGVKVQNNVSIYAGVTIEDEVFLGPSMVFTNIKNPRSAISRKGEYETTLVKKGASIGANVTIICGSEIGTYAFIGAGAVVTKDVKPYALITGNPGRQTGWMSRHGHRLHFDADGLAHCPESGITYQLKEGFVNELNED